MTILLPRLPGPSAEGMLDRMFADDDLQWPGFDPHTLPDEVRYASTGGSRVDPQQLDDMRKGLLKVAEEHGFGTHEASATQARFDAALAAWLVQQPLLGTGDALRDDVWSFLSIVLAPDVVHWRFGASRSRYLGGIRNAFQRLWMRAKVLDRGEDADDRWGLLDRLTEDALVQITERPSIGADAILSRELAEGWVRAAARLGRRKMEDVMRLAILRLRIRNEIRSLSLLPEAELAPLIDEFFDSAAETLGKSEDAPLLEEDQGETSSSTKDEGGDDAESGVSRTRRRSWAIWRAR